MLFRWGALKVYSYGVMVALAILVATTGLAREFRRRGYAEEAAFDLAVIAVLAGLAGARLYYVVFYAWEWFRLHPLSILDLRSGGLVFFGAILGGMVGFVVAVKWKKLPPWSAADMVAPYLALAYAVGRVGCFLNGCCYGRPTTLPLGVVFPSVDSLPRHPTQLYSVLAGLILYVVLRRLLRARRFEGQVILAYLGGYSLLRIAIEFLRENLVVWHGLTMAQVTALAVLLAVAPLYAWRKDYPPPVEPATGKEGETNE